MKPLKELIEQLLPEERRKVRAYIEFLLVKQQARSRRQPRFGWAEALKDLRGQFTSVELQHQLTQWRSEEE